MRSLASIFLALATLSAPLARCANVTVEIRVHHLTSENAARYTALNKLVADNRGSAELQFGPGVYGDNVSFAVGERVRCVAVSTEKTSAAARVPEVQEILQTMPIELDATGAVRATGCLEGAQVVEVPYKGSGTEASYSYTCEAGYIGALKSPFVDPSADTGLQGVMGEDYVAEQASPYDYWEANVLADAAYNDKYFYLFVIIEDTRNSQGTPGSGTVSYGAALVMADVYEVAHPDNNPAYSLGKVDWSKFNYSARVLAGGSLMLTQSYDRCFLSPVKMKSLALPARLTVGDTAYTGEEVEKILSPALAGLALTEEGWTLSFAKTTDGEVASQMPDVALPDYLRYTVMTKTDLKADWIPLDKVLDNTGGNVYTRLRLVDLGTLVLPTVDGESSRFYKIEQAQ
ncbi:MAG: hypothetical protein MSB12_01630 [Lentisphaeraceae bacterium]|nr:hypothetical protein [Lentisphaeraceae bacterium]